MRTHIFIFHRLVEFFFHSKFQLPISIEIHEKLAIMNVGWHRTKKIGTNLLTSLKKRFLHFTHKHTDTETKFNANNKI